MSFKLFLFLLTINIVYSLLRTVDAASTGERSSSIRKKRTAIISLPTAGGVRWTQQIIAPVLALINQTNTYLWFDFQVYTSVPSASSINLLYNSFGRYKDRTGVEIDETFVEEQRANQERRSVYKYLESFFSNFGLNGPACMKRAICEMSEAPLSGNGLFGKAVELILTPSLMKMPKEMEPHHVSVNQTELDAELDFITAPVDDEYAEAYRRGKSGLCWSHYAACSVNIFKLLNF